MADWNVLVVAGVSGTDLRSFLRVCQNNAGWRQTPIQLTVSRAMARGRPVWIFSASRAWSMTDWWYWANQWCPTRGANRTDLIGAVREIHADDIEASCCRMLVARIARIIYRFAVPLRRALIFSTELVLGPVRGSDVSDAASWSRGSKEYQHTNGSNDGGATVVLRRHHLGVKLGEPLQLHAVVEVIEGSAGSHFTGLRIGD